MHYNTKRITFILQFMICCFFLVSCSTKNKSFHTIKDNKFKESKTLSQITKPSQTDSSFSQKLAQAREKTELIDDQTEKMLNRHKKWFLLGVIVFLWLGFQSLINYSKD